MTARALDRAAGEPLWAQLLGDLRRRLDLDEFRTAFPGELALVAEYGVSRHTVREAVRRLRAITLNTLDKEPRWRGRTRKATTR